MTKTDITLLVLLIPSLILACLDIGLISVARDLLDLLNRKDS